MDISHFKFVVLPIESVCRLCLRGDSPLIPMFANSNSSTAPLASQISECVRFEIKHSKGLPSKVCGTCMQEVKRWIQFCDKCQLSNNALHNALKLDGSNESVAVRLHSTNDNMILQQVPDIIQVDNHQHHKEQSALGNEMYEQQRGDDSPTVLSTSLANTVSEEAEGSLDGSDIDSADISDDHSANSGSDDNTTNGIANSIQTNWRLKATPCPLCNKIFNRHDGVKLHLKVVHTIIKPFPCRICSQVFCSFEDRKGHIEKRHPIDSIDPYTCRLCSVGTTSERSHRVHISMHEQEFTCKLCKTPQSSVEALKSHLKTHHNIEPRKDPPVGMELKYQCHLCPDFSFWNVRDWKEHYLDVHRTQNTYPCPLCDRAFRTTKLRDVHSRRHTGEKPFMCDQCPARFSSKCSMKNHMRKHTDRFQCQECQKPFASNHELSAHMRHHTGEKPFICDECGKTFSSPNGLVFHLRIHSGETPYSCDICNYKFKSHTGLYAHKVVHSTERPHKCDQCGKAFKMKSWLKEHQKTHAGVKNFVCDLCNHAFIAKYQLTSHLRTHSGERPHVCEFCSKTFARRDTLTEHRRTHTKETKYSCKTCCKEFMFLKPFKKHKCSLNQVGEMDEIMVVSHNALECNN